MKYSKLPPEYKKLADKYEVRCVGDVQDDLEFRFYWDTTDEGDTFWCECRDARSIDDLPDIPVRLSGFARMMTYPYDPSSSQVGGDHYTQLKIQPLDVILANDLNFLEGNVIKYVLRHRNKGLDSDLKKAIDCLEKLIEHEYGDK